MASPQTAPTSSAKKPASASRPAAKRIHTSYVAVRVRNKLQDAAAAPEWNLSRLVAHANTLDTLAIRLSDPDRKKKHEAEEEAAKQNDTKEAADAHPSSPRLSSTVEEEEGQHEDAPKEEEEEAFSDYSSDELSSSDGWHTTEPSTALEHGEQADYFGLVAEKSVATPQTHAKVPSVVVITPTTESLDAAT